MNLNQSVILGIDIKKETIRNMDEFFGCAVCMTKHFLEICGRQYLREIVKKDKF